MDDEADEEEGVRLEDASRKRKNNKQLNLLTHQYRMHTLRKKTKYLGNTARKNFCWVDTSNHESTY